MLNNMTRNKNMLVPVLVLLAGTAAIYSTQTLADSAVETATIAEPDENQRHAMSMAFNISEAFSYAAETIEPSVVHITTRTNTRRGPVNGGLGSGVIVDTRGYIITNSHVIANGNTIVARLNDGREFEADLIGTFPESDIAVIRIESDDLVPASFADSEALKVGQWVLAVGSPFGYNQTVTTGIVSAKGRSPYGPDGENRGSAGQLQEFIQTDAAINPGNSGGPLVDLNGNIVGINTAIISRTGSNNGLGFAIPADIAQAVMEQLIETGDVERGWLGIQMAPLDPVTAHEMDLPGGVVINRILEGGPAEAAGLQANDIITAIGGRSTENLVRLSNAIMLIKPSEPAEVTFIRNGDVQTTSAILADRDREFARSNNGAYIERIGLGVLPTPIREQISRRNSRTTRGYLVVDVEKDSIAQQVGFQSGDVIVEVDGLTIDTPERLERYFTNAITGLPLTIQILRENELMSVELTLD